MRTAVILSIFLNAFLLSCNPDCDTFLFIESDAIAYQHDQELLLTSDNLAALQGRNVIFSSRSANTRITVESRYVPGTGLLVRVPNGINGQDVQISVEDTDCGPATLGRTLTIGDAAFFADNPNFIPPPVFNFVIPILPPAFPPLVRNAWINPENTDYCLWLRFVRNENGEETNTICPATSRELSAALTGGCPGGSSFYHGNRVTGIVDKRPDRNVLHLWIDRGTNGTEEFIGQFINIQDTEFGDLVPECDAPFGGPVWDPKKEYMMLLRSQNTGRQLLLFQQETIPTINDIDGEETCK